MDFEIVMCKVTHSFAVLQILDVQSSLQQRQKRHVTCGFWRCCNEGTSGSFWGELAVDGEVGGDDGGDV
ncbi:MAG: hypothetical protein LIP03_04700, partial [Bacteroidales bacterium]|nr:hypothetical protein [Bacteroidales bacterium]